MSVINRFHIFIVFWTIVKQSSHLLLCCSHIQNIFMNPGLLTCQIKQPSDLKHREFIDIITIVCFLNVKKLCKDVKINTAYDSVS